MSQFTRRSLPRYLAPLPAWLEEFALENAWLLVAVNLAGTAFGFYYYLPQFSIEPLVAWPVVPDSPVATLFIAASLALWKLGRSNEYVNALAFLGCIKLGLWTPYVLAVFKTDFSYLHPLMYNFLFWSHLAMAVQAFIIYRYASFPAPAVTFGVAWYAFNDIVDYFVPVVGNPHHTLVPAEQVGFIGTDGAAAFDHSLVGHDVAAAGAIAITIIAIGLLLATRASLTGSDD